MSFDEIFDLSYERVVKTKRNGKTFFDCFYDHFIGSSPDIAQAFQHTDMNHQKKMLKKSFYSLFTFYATNCADDYLETIANRHSGREHGIKPELYDLWLETLIETVRAFDPEFNDDIELSWRLVLSPGITYMKFKYDK